MNDDKGLVERQIVTLFEKSEGKAWEPPRIDHPWIKQLIEDGWLKRCPMRCGFEAFDTGVTWTAAGKAAIEAAARIQVLSDRIAVLTDAVRCMVEAHHTGKSSSKGRHDAYVKAMSALTPQEAMQNKTVRAMRVPRRSAAVPAEPEVSGLRPAATIARRV